MTNRAPEYKAERFDCPRCGAFTHHTWFSLIRNLNDEGTSTTLFQDEYIMNRAAHWASHTPSHWAASECFSCEKFAVWRGKKLIFPDVDPERESPHELMSPASAIIFQEAVAVLPHSRRAAAALARAAMESELRHLLDDRKSDLHTLIGKLGGKISAALWQGLTIVRDLGNKALHGGEPEGVVALLLDESDAELAPFMLTAVNQIVDEMVARPKQVNALYEMLPQGVREAAERKRDEHAAPEKIE